MNDSQKQRLQFYQDGSALQVLKRYEFSEEEKKLISDAIRTSKMNNPRMKLIEEADTMLKEVVKTRQTISADTVAINPQDIAKLEAKAIGSIVQKDSIALYIIKKLPVILIIGIFIALIVNNTNRVEDKPLSPVTFKQAQEICTEKKMLLPISYEDFGNILFQPTYKNEIGYWTGEQTIATFPNRMFIKDDGKAHYVYCVKKNRTKFTH